jgi:hypothetical protein
MVRTGIVAMRRGKSAAGNITTAEDQDVEEEDVSHSV